MALVNEKLNLSHAGGSPTSFGHRLLNTSEGSGPTTGNAQGEFDAAIFDMDGVITKTAAVHSHWNSRKIRLWGTLTVK